jgi:hypothetical protein
MTAAQRRELKALQEIAGQIVVLVVRRDPWLLMYADDLKSLAVTELLKANERRAKQKLTALENPAGYMTRVVQHRVTDLARHREVQNRQLRLLADELPAGVRIQGIDEHGRNSDVFPRNNELRGLSLQVISKEEDHLHSLQAQAMIHVLTDEGDKDLLTDRFFAESQMTLAQLGIKHGGRSATAMANYLAKIVGTANAAGAVEPAAIVVGKLPMKTADAFVKILQNFDELDLLSDPITTAIGHLEFAAHYSEDHRQQAILGIARLRYLSRHMPNSRGLSNKVLIRLIKAACFYVLEVNDGRHDRQDARGLQDDVAVLKAVGDAVGRYLPKP